MLWTRCLACPCSCKAHQQGVNQSASSCPPTGTHSKTWTACIPLQIDGEAKGCGLWHRMVTEDFLAVAVQTVWLVTGRIVHAQEIRRAMAHHVVPKLAHRPPLATGVPPGPTTAACMARPAL